MPSLPSTPRGDGGQSRVASTERSGSISESLSPYNYGSSGYGGSGGTFLNGPPSPARWGGGGSERDSFNSGRTSSDHSKEKEGGYSHTNGANGDGGMNSPALIIQRPAAMFPPLQVMGLDSTGGYLTPGTPGHGSGTGSGTGIGNGGNRTGSGTSNGGGGPGGNGSWMSDLNLNTHHTGSNPDNIIPAIPEESEIIGFGNASAAAARKSAGNSGGQNNNNPAALAVETNWMGVESEMGAIFGNHWAIEPNPKFTKKNLLRVEVPDYNVWLGNISKNCVVGACGGGCHMGHHGMLYLHVQ
jgi:hypothetical protein